MINKNTIIKKNEDMVSADLNGMIVMMSIDNGEYYGLNEVATVIWDRIEKSLSVEELVEELMEEFNVSQEQCEVDVIGFLEKLHEKNLIFI